LVFIPSLKTYLLYIENRGKGKRGNVKALDIYREERKIKDFTLPIFPYS